MTGFILEAQYSEAADIAFRYCVGGNGTVNERKKAERITLAPLVPEKDLDVQFRDDHVRITLGPDYEITPRQESEFWDAIARMNAGHGSRRILIEGFAPKGERTTGEVIRSGRKTGTVPKLWIAFCLENFVPSEQSELFEAIAATRGARVRFFADRQLALKWLRRNAPA